MSVTISCPQVVLKLLKYWKQQYQPWRVCEKLITRQEQNPNRYFQNKRHGQGHKVFDLDDIESMQDLKIGRLQVQVLTAVIKIISTTYKTLDPFSQH